MSRLLPWIAGAVFLVSGCKGVVYPAGGGNRQTPPAGDTADAGCAADQNDQIRLALLPVCGPCHGASSPRPFVASLNSFDSLLVYNTSFVVAGNPDQSTLVQLLEGTATGLYTQMPPPPNAPFAVQAEQGRTTIDVAAIRDWITHLPPPPVATTQPSPSAPTTRRLTAEEMVLSLRQQLGLQQQGLMDTRDVDLSVRAADIAGDQDYLTPAAFARWAAVGGPNTLASVPRSKVLSPTVLVEWVQISQDWCQAAVHQSPSNAVLFKYATPSSKSATDSAAIRQNIGYLYLNLLGDPPSPSAIDDLYQAVYVVYEPAGTDVAWTAVCADLVRHPQWMSF